MEPYVEAVTFSFDASELAEYAQQYLGDDYFELNYEYGETGELEVEAYDGQIRVTASIYATDSKDIDEVFHDYLLQEVDGNTKGIDYGLCNLNRTLEHDGGNKYTIHYGPKAESIASRVHEADKEGYRKGYANAMRSVLYDINARRDNPVTAFASVIRKLKNENLVVELALEQAVESAVHEARGLPWAQATTTE